MQAIRVHELGDASQLKYEQAPMPDPKPGQVRVKVAAIGLNYVEIYQRKGQNVMPLPFTPGGEFAGTIDALGEGVTGLEIGQRVATASGAGAYAAYAVAPADHVAPVPEGVSLEQAAAVMLQGMTAHYLVYSTFPLKPGHVILAHAAAGGVGQLLVQIAKMLQARVIATVGSDEKVAIARDCGADEVINYTMQDFETETRRLTNGRGVDVVYDGVGKATFDKSLSCLRLRGYMVLYGQASGPVPPVDPQTLNKKGSLFLTRPLLGHYILDPAEFLWRANDLFKWLASGELKMRIDRTFPLNEAAAAQQYMEARQTRGKVLIVP